MKICPYCGRENDDDAIVCQKCCAGFPKEVEEKSSEQKESRSARRKSKE